MTYHNISTKLTKSLSCIILGMQYTISFDTKCKQRKTMFTFHHDEMCFVQNFNQNGDLQCMTNHPQENVYTLLEDDVRAAVYST